MTMKQICWMVDLSKKDEGTSILGAFHGNKNWNEVL